jgi:hypothetical protein
MSGEQLLDIDGALEDLKALGMTITRHQMQRWASERQLPFFKLGKKIWILRRELRKAIDDLQADAVCNSLKPRTGRRVAPARKVTVTDHSIGNRAPQLHSRRGSARP